MAANFCITSLGFQDILPFDTTLKEWLAKNTPNGKMPSVSLLLFDRNLGLYDF